MAHTFLDLTDFLVITARGMTEWPPTAAAFAKILNRVTTHLTEDVLALPSRPRRRPRRRRHTLDQSPGRRPGHSEAPPRRDL